MGRQASMGALAVVALVMALPAWGELDFEAGKWRLELSGLSGVHSGSTDRSGDLLVTGTVDYEFPATEHTTLGLRLMPLFLYGQDAPDDCCWDDDNDNEYDGGTVWGAGVGLTGRLYVKGDYRGLFFEGQANVVVHDEKVVGNSANVNFLTGVGMGYKFQCDWHVVVKYEHISNADLGDENDGANVLGLGVGYTF